MSRTKKAAKNIIFNITNQVIALILAFASRTIFIRSLGQELLGINGLFSDVLNLLSMADLGFNVAMVYSFYQPLAANDKKAIAGLVRFYRRIYRIIAFAIAAIGLAIIPILPRLINLEQEVSHINLYYSLSLFNIVASYLYVHKTSVLTADQNNYIISKVNIICQSIQIMFQIAVLILFKNYALYLIIAIIATLCKNIVCSHIAERKYPYIRNAEPISRENRRDIFLNVFSCFIYKTVNVVLNATDNLLISVIVGTVFVGYYSNYQLIQTRLVSLYALIFTSLTATVGNVIVTESAEKRLNVFQCEQTISNIISCIIVPCYILLASDFIRIWLNSDYMLKGIDVAAMGVNIYFSCILQPLWTFREAVGLYKHTKFVMAMCAVLNIILSILLGKICGLFGIVIASALSRLFTYIWYEPHLLFNLYFEQSAKYYFVELLKNIILVIFITMICYICTMFLFTDSFSLWLFKAGIVFLVSLIIAVFSYQKSKGFALLKRYVLRLIYREERD